MTQGFQSNTTRNDKSEKFLKDFQAQCSNETHRKMHILEKKGRKR